MGFFLSMFKRFYISNFSPIHLDKTAQALLSCIGAATAIVSPRGLNTFYRHYTALLSHLCCTEFYTPSCSCIVDLTHSGLVKCLLCKCQSSQDKSHIETIKISVSVSLFSLPPALLPPTFHLRVSSVCFLAPHDILERMQQSRQHDQFYSETSPMTSKCPSSVSS